MFTAISVRDAFHNGFNNDSMSLNQFVPTSPFKLTGLHLMSTKLRFLVSVQFPNIPRHLVRDRYARARLLTVKLYLGHC